MKYIKTIIFFICLVLILNLLSSILYYFDITNDKTNHILKIINFIIIYLSTGLYIGKLSKSKGWLEGLKISLIVIALSIMLILIIPSTKFTLISFIYYLLLTLLIISGSQIGLNLKIKKSR